MPPNLGPPDDRDLACQRCAYNLRGLPGDPRRCPECGHENALRDFDVSTKRINDCIATLDSLPAVATFFAGVVLTFLPGMMLIVFNEPLGLCFAVPTVSSGFVWMLLIHQMKRAFSGRCDWVRLVVLHHAWGLGLSTLLLMTPILMIHYGILLREGVGWSGSRYSGSLREMLAICLGLPAYGGLFGYFLKSVHPRLQREYQARVRLVAPIVAIQDSLVARS